MWRNNNRIRFCRVALTIRLLFAYIVPYARRKRMRCFADCRMPGRSYSAPGRADSTQPQVRATIYDSVQLAVLVWREILGHRGTPLN